MKKQNLQSNYDSQVDVGRRLFLEYDQERFIHKFQLDAEEQWIYLTYMNTPFRINRTIDEFCDDAWTECRNYSTVFFPVLLRFWEGDDEFPHKLQLMWDGTQTASCILKPHSSSSATCWSD